MKAFAEFNDYEIAHEYEDAGKSGKSIEGRTQFNQMMEDIKTARTAFPLFWYSSCPVLAEMRRMSFPPCRSCRILAST